MDRRSYITTIGLISLSGCSTVQTEDSATESTNNTDITTGSTNSTDSATESITESVNCQQQVSRPEPNSDPELSAKDYPEFPDYFSEPALQDYCQSFERAFIWNWLLSQATDLEQVSVRFPRDSLLEISGGVAEYQSDVRVTYSDVSSNGESVQGDLKYSIEYNVSKSITERESDRRGGPPDSIVDCH